MNQNVSQQKNSLYSQIHCLSGEIYISNSMKLPNWRRRKVAIASKIDMCISLWFFFIVTVNTGMCV